MPVMICAHCKGQVKDSFHKEPIGLKTTISEEMKSKAKEFEKEQGIEINPELPKKWCNCKQIKEIDDLQAEIDNKISILSKETDTFHEQVLNK